MPLELATRLILRDPHDGSPLSEEPLRAAVADWAGIRAAATEMLESAVGRGGARVTTRESRVPGTCRWDLDFVRTDDDDPTVEWRVETTALFEPDRTSFVSCLRRDSTDHRLRPLAGSPAPPNVVRRILSAPRVECFDGPLRVEPRFRELRADDIEGFVATQLEADDRRLPIIGIAKVPQTSPGRLDIVRLRGELAGFAHIVLFDRGALMQLGRALGDLSIAPASARIWWPGLLVDDRSDVHPHWASPFNEPGEVVEQIRRLVLTVSRDRWREPERLSSFRKAQRRLQEQEARDAVAQIAEQFERLRGAAAEQAAQTPAADTSKREQQLVTAQARLEQLSDELERQGVAVTDAEAHWEEAEEGRERLERENRTLRGRLDGLEAQLRERGAVEVEALADSAQIEFEVRSSWKERMTTNDRASHPLADFTIRDGFLASVDAAAADRRKVVDTVMEVACGRAKDFDGRRPHRLRSGKSGNDPVRRRASDDATAWRCNVQTNSPSARRLHYWLCPGGRIEFVSVVVHDDFSIAD